ncbi:branched-chain amino acid transport system II carrier protein [Phascolarctobacterium sp. CAG:266]|nr:branched-chain amino acid transport system II carrier protein [Phascolarctobacterium sp. CAG:266]
MKQKLTFMEILPIGLMLFASFFGAGNLIFPPALGQSAGVNFLPAAAGFCTTGVGIPLLGIIAIGLLRASNPEALALPVHPKFAKALIVVTVLTIGPFFAIPRTGAVSFDVGILPFISAENYDLGLALYSLFFFVVTYFLSVNPSKIVDWVGKILTPLLLISIAILVVQVFMHPMGEPQQAGGYYASMPYLKGFQEGYYTMDLLATMLFGTVVIDSIKVRGISEGSVLTRTCIMAGIIAAVLLAAIYFSLTYTGATSVAVFGVSDNGAIALSSIANYYMGTAGNVVLCLMIFFACLTTSIGLTVSAGSYLEQVLKYKMQYQRIAAIICIFSFAVSNVGLTKIISLSVPVLCLLYPIVIVLVMMAFMPVKRACVYRSTLAFTIVFAIIDGLNAAGVPMKTAEALFKDVIPFYSAGFGWFVPSIVGLVLGILYSVAVKPDKN